MIPEKPQSALPRRVQLWHAASMLSPLVYLDLLYRRDVFGIAELFAEGDHVLLYGAVGLGVLGLSNIALGVLFPKWLVLSSKPIRAAEDRALDGLRIRAATFHAPAVYGLMLGILGAPSFVPLAFIVPTIAALCLTFPTQNRWQKLLAQAKVQ